VYKVNLEVCSYLMKGKLLLGAPDEVKEAREQKTD
jgi:hypothetical protein